MGVARCVAAILGGLVTCVLGGGRVQGSVDHRLLQLLQRRLQPVVGLIQSLDGGGKLPAGMIRCSDDAMSTMLDSDALKERNLEHIQEGKMYRALNVDPERRHMDSLQLLCLKNGRAS